MLVRLDQDPAGGGIIAHATDRNWRKDFSVAQIHAFQDWAHSPDAVRCRAAMHFKCVA
jgi:hypothetical protein